MVRSLSIALALVLGTLVQARAQDVPDLSKASRIVAVGGSVTEIVYALGEEKRLIARDSTSVYPEAALKLPDVGYIRALSPEGVLSVDPDAILALDGSGPPEAVEVLKKASVPIVTIPETFDRAGILEKIRVVGDALGVEDKASAVMASVDADIKAAETEAAASGAATRVLFVLSMQGGKVLASGTATAADGIIRMGIPVLAAIPADDDIRKKSANNQIIGFPGGQWGPLFEELALNVSEAGPQRPNPLTQDGLLALFASQDVGGGVVLEPASQADMRGGVVEIKPSLEVVYDTV